VRHVTPPVGFLLAAILGILSFPPLGLWPLAYIALVPFLTAAAAASPRTALGWGYVGGFVFFSGLLYWIGINCGAPRVLAWSSAAAMVAILATIWAITAWAVAHTAAKRSLIAAALLFVTLYAFFEVFWGSGEMGFPWAIWALTQVKFLPAAQIAELGDVWLVSLWVLTINALFFLIWKSRLPRRTLLGVLAAVLILPPLLGAIRMKTMSTQPTVSVAAVQGNTPMDEKWQKSAEEILANYLNLSRALTATNTKLIVWPETATPMPLRFRPLARRQIQSFVDSAGIFLLSGATDYRDGGRQGMLPYNSAFFFSPGGVEPATYAKMHLVPFGERMPGQRLFPVLGKVRLGQAEFLPGDTPVVFRPPAPMPSLACMICYEVVFPDVAAAFVRRGAALLVNITEDGWYRNSSGPYQHLVLAQLRAIATRRSIVRAVNSGISALILPTGELTATLGYNRVGVVCGALPVRHEITPAVRLARLWLPLYAGLLLCVFAVLFLTNRKKAARNG
jgi:apolipoprotein N-acyltransferase